MSSYEELKPIYRSKLRVFLGRHYYITKRYLSWFLGKNNFSRLFIKDKLEYQVFEHKTPLYRKLKDVDMWLQENKVVNLKVAIKKVNGIIIRPGETFSYWKCIGKPLKIKGYKKGMTLHYGDFVAKTGGGLCQLSNMLYWMALHTPLTIIERHRHSFDVFPDANRTQPFGSGATCVYNYRDLKIKNDTNETYQINISINEKYLVGEIRSDIKPYLSFEVYERNHKMTHEYWGCYVRHNVINRKISDLEGYLMKDEYVCENHALMMYDPLLEERSYK